MDAQQAEKVGTLAKSLYTNRLAASMDDAYKMAENILSKSSQGEARSMNELSKRAPQAVTTDDASFSVKKASPIRVSEHRIDGQSSSIKEDNPKSDLSKIAALKQVVSDEEERITLLKEELSSLKQSIKVSGETQTGVDLEIEGLEKDINSAKEDISHIRQHIHDLEEIKQEIKEAEEAQQESDEMAIKAESVHEQAQEWTPPKPEERKEDD